MYTKTKEQLINNFKAQIADVLLQNSAGVYLITHSTDSYLALRSTPLLDSILGQRGSYSDMFEKLFFARETGEASSYRSFMEKGLPSGKIYARRIRIRPEKESRDMNFIYIPGSGNEDSYVLLCPIGDFYTAKDMSIVKQKALDDGFLYSMVVDLDMDRCYSPHVSEVYYSEQDSLDLRFSEWREQISLSFLPDFLPLFREKTDPAEIRRRLTSEKRFSFDIQMQNLDSRIIWTRHSLLQIRDEVEGHLMLVYTVQDIDTDKKKLFQQFRIISQTDEQKEKEAAEPAASEEETGENAKNISALSTVILNQIEQEIREHYMDKLTLNQMARKYFINSAYLGQLFIRKYDMTFHEYLTTQRMENAAYLLSNSDYSVRQIIDMVGISSTHYFNRLFKEFYGCTPTIYRRSSS